MKNYISETSRVIKLLNGTCTKYSSLEKRLDDIYINSLLCKMIKLFLGNMFIVFRYSFIGRITEITEEDNSKKILENSRFVKWLLRICRDWGRIITNYLKTSFTANCAAGLENKLYVSPVKTGSIIVVTALLSDIVFNIIRKEIGLLGWIIRGMLLFVGLAGLFCKIGLENLSSTSLVLKWAKRK